MRVNQANSSAVSTPIPKTIWAEKVLHDDEEIILLIKPHQWNIFLSSLPMLLSLAIVSLAINYLHASGNFISDSLYNLMIFICMIAGIVQVFAATIAWNAKFYVLTNRRVLLIKGAIYLQITDCDLKLIKSIEVAKIGFEKFTKLGTVRIEVRDNPYLEIDWINLADPDDIKNKICQAIKNRPLDIDEIR